MEMIYFYKPGFFASPLKIEHAKKILRSSERFKNSDGYIIYDKVELSLFRL